MGNRFIEYLKSELVGWSIEYRIHATRRLFERDVEGVDVLFLLKNGIVIEEYSEDYPFPSVLVNGKTKSGRPLHVVIGIDSPSQRLYIITAYEPNPQKWTDNFSRRIDK